MFVSIMAFHSRISDPRVGGTYLTLLNTVTNFGGNWCQTLALWMVDGLTWTTCVGAPVTRQWQDQREGRFPFMYL